MSVNASALRDASGRLDVIDALRGLAVVFMIALHTSHGWAAPGWREGAAWTVLRSLGGMAAPLFLLLAGVSVGFGWRRSVHASDARTHARAIAARGLGVLVLGYVLRVQMWMIDANGYRDRRAWLAAGALVLGYALLHRGFARWGVGRGNGVGLLLGAGASAVAVGAVAVATTFPARMAGVFRVDVLQAIGASIALVSLGLAGFGPHRGRLVAVGGCVACLAPWVETWDTRWLPSAIEGYLVRRPTAPGVPAAGLFPLFPWAAYGCVGAALGLDWAEASRVGRLAPRLAKTALLGALLAVASCELVPVVSAAITAHPWLTHPVRVAYRIGLSLVFAAACIVLVRSAALRWPLVTFGQASLLVYWVHLEFAFGVAARPLARRLNFADWCGWTLVLLAAMLVVAALAVGMRRTPMRRDWGLVTRNRIGL
jgi:uncharacterized membrane protein